MLIRADPGPKPWFKHFHVCLSSDDFHDFLPILNTTFNTNEKKKYLKVLHHGFEALEHALLDDPDLAVVGVAYVAVDSGHQGQKFLLKPEKFKTK